MQFSLELEGRLDRAPNRPADLVITHSAAQQGFARMFQTLNDHPMVTIAVFADRTSALAWLQEA